MQSLISKPAFETTRIFSARRPAISLLPKKSKTSSTCVSRAGLFNLHSIDLLESPSETIIFTCLRALTNRCAFAIQELPVKREERTRPERERESARLAAEAEAKRQREEQWARDGATMLYSFEVSHETHLAATEREQVLMLEPQSDRTDGWCRVQNSAGDEGLVPTAYLETFENRNARERAVADAAELRRALEEKAHFAAQQSVAAATGSDAKTAGQHGNSIVSQRVKDLPSDGIENPNPIPDLWSSNVAVLSLHQALLILPLSDPKAWDEANLKYSTPSPHFPFDQCANQATKAFTLSVALTSAGDADEKQSDRDPGSSLSVDEMAAIRLYTMESPFYHTLNLLLRSVERAHLQSYLPYLRLFIGGLAKLKTTARTLYRGVNRDLSEQYHKDDMKTWWPISSTTSQLSVLKDERYFNLQQPRTLFISHARHAVDIRQYSAIENEAELVLLPGATFQVEDVLELSQNPKCTMITLQETVDCPKSLIGRMCDFPGT
jgi:hypothetical protein